MNKLKPALSTLALLPVLALAACGDDDGATTTGAEVTGAEAPADTAPAGDVDTSMKPAVTVPDGPPPKELEIVDLVEGDGAEAKPGNLVTVQYVGVGYSNGEEFDASWDRGQPFPFELGGGQVIEGWDQGVAGMRVGGRRELVIPPQQAYGKQGSPPVIGPDETLVFVIDLLAVE